MRGGPSTDERLPFLMLGGDGDLRYYGKDNIAVDAQGKTLPMFGRYGETQARKLIEANKPVSWPAGPSRCCPRDDVETHVLANAGARPWDRDADDIRVLFFVAEGRGEIIDDEKDVSAYPASSRHARLSSRPTGTSTRWSRNRAAIRAAKGPIQEHLSDRDKAMRQ